MRRTKVLLSCLLALALVMLTACGARQHADSAFLIRQRAYAPRNAIGEIHNKLPHNHR